MIPFLKNIFVNRENEMVILKNTENKNSYENRVADFDKKYSSLLKEGLLSSDLYFSSREYYGMEIYGTDVVLVK